MGFVHSVGPVAGHLAQQFHRGFKGAGDLDPLHRRQGRLQRRGPPRGVVDQQDPEHVSVYAMGVPPHLLPTYPGTVPKSGDSPHVQIAVSECGIFTVLGGAGVLNWQPVPDDSDRVRLDS